jgi:hypothetical protein
LQYEAFHAFHAAMMGTKGQISENTVDKMTESVDLDVNWLKQDMAAPTILQAFDAVREGEATRLLFSRW